MLVGKYCKESFIQQTLPITYYVPNIVLEKKEKGKVPAHKILREFLSYDTMNLGCKNRKSIVSLSYCSIISHSKLGS